MSDSFESIYNELALANDSGPSERDLLAAIQDRVAFLLQNDPDLLMSYMYRLDIDEKKINAVLNEGAGNDVVLALADLILQRQKQRLETRKKYAQKPIEGWEY
jgi:hypothetical protein